jgi:two-component system response regulator RegX3
MGWCVNVLVVEDRPALRQGLVDLLQEAGHAVEAVEDGLEAIRRVAAHPFDLVVLDRMLPRRDGLDVCRRIRSARPDTLVLMLTALGSENDKVDGFRAGADDYVTKPFAARELLARIEALGRRVRTAPGPAAPFEADGCRFDLDRLATERDGTTTALTKREADIVRLLRHHRGRPVTRAELLEDVWGVDGDLMTRTVDVTVAKLRRKIEAEPAVPRLIRTVKGVGYAWGVE